MHVHILGIGGTFMGGLACLAKAQGHTVTGQDKKIYPPMSLQLEKLGIPVHEGYDEEPLKSNSIDCVIVGNALSRGTPVIEALLNQQLPFCSGPEWLKQNILKDRWVIGVAGTHGKTTTSSMVAWILEYAGLKPGFLIGGVPSNFEFSARLGDYPFFVIESDEYDSAFFDKRSKFMHYAPQTCILNNLEYDHADIFENMEAIYKQFHHFVRTLPGKGLIIRPQDDSHLDNVLEMGCWTPTESFGLTVGDWQVNKIIEDGSEFELFLKGQKQGKVKWNLIGDHNVLNALAAIAAARHCGVPLPIALEALSEFKSVKRRLEVRGKVNNITVYDDFAHHPTAIRLTLNGLRDKVKHERIYVVLDIRSNTMKAGGNKELLGGALAGADKVALYKTPEVQWDVTSLVNELGSSKAQVFENTESIIQKIMEDSRENDHILIMSNGGFDGIHAKMLNSLESLSA